MATEPDVQAPALNRRKVGDIVVTYLSDGFVGGSFDWFPGIDAGEAAAMLEAAHRPPLPHPALAGYLVQGRGRTVLVDTGAGGFAGWGGRLPVAMAAAGVAPEDIDTVLISHGHVDHVGGLTLHGRPVFPRAEVVVSETELNFWRDDGVMASAGVDAEPFFRAAREAFAAYDDRLRPATAGEVSPGITLVPLPGHTPGHSGFRIASGKDQLLLWTDIVHLPDIQIVRPEITMAFDADPDQARATRLKLFDEVAADTLTVGGMHLNMPGFLTLERRGTGYAKVDLPWLAELV